MQFIGQREEIKEYQGRYFYFKIFIAFSFVILFARVWYFQILNGSRFYTYSKENSLKQEKIPASRGIIMDRNREIMVDSYPSFDITWTPQYVTEPKGTLKRLSELLKMPEEGILAVLEKQKRVPRFQARIVRKDATREEVALIEANRFDMPGVDVSLEIKRKYHHKEIGAHLLGYISEINEKELERLNRKSFIKYRQGDFVGKFGMEERWEEYLRGIDGANYAEVDAFGREKVGGVPLFDMEQKIKRPQPGKNLVLTIDEQLQQAAAKTLRDREGNPKAGALVAIDPNNGEILAMVSQPGFDPTDFSRGVSADIYKDLIANEKNPLLDKAIQDAYPPGSTFKLITAMAGLDLGVIDPNEKLNCNGYYYLGRARYRCWTWRKGGHGKVDLRKAIHQSCDTYFYRAGVKIGIDNIAKYAKMLGLGSKSGMNLRGEVAGTVPTKAWKKKRFKEKWYPGETPPVAIGQGFLTTTVVQLARAYTAIANGGTLYIPYIVRRIEEPDGRLIQEFGPQIVKTEKIKDETWRHIREGLYAVVNVPGGTAYWSGRVDGLDIAGKTGTAQVIRIKAEDREKKCEQLEWKYRDHGWFVGYAPVDKPQIVVAALGIHDCHPYSGASKAVRDVIKAYLQDKVDPRFIRFKPKKKKVPGA